MILNPATLSFMETDRHTKKLKLNNLGTTSGKKPQAKLRVWSRSPHYLHSGWAAAADPLLLSESFILLRLIYSQLALTHLDTLVTPCSLSVPLRKSHRGHKKEPCKQREGSLTHPVAAKNEINHIMSSVLVRIGDCLREHMLNAVLLPYHEVNFGRKCNCLLSRLVNC